MIEKLHSAVQAAQNQPQKCAQLQRDLETLQQLKEKHEAGVDVSAAIARLRG